MRLNIYENGKLIGQDYQHANGEWMHKWYDSRRSCFERGSWRGRAEGENKKQWVYKRLINNKLSQKDL